MARRYLFTSSAGIRHYMVEEGGQTYFQAEGDVTPILEDNKRLLNANDGYSDSRELRRAARIPYAIGLKWLNEEGWWFMNASHDPDVARKLAAKLNSSEYAHLRTAPGRIGVSDGRLR